VTFVPAQKMDSLSYVPALSQKYCNLTGKHANVQRDSLAKFVTDNASVRMGPHVTQNLECASVLQISLVNTVVLPLVSALHRSV
jgi:hypothetical protein